MFTHTDSGYRDKGRVQGRKGKGGHTLEEIHGLIGNQVSSQVLTCIHTTDDQGSVSVCSLPQLD